MRTTMGVLITAMTLACGSSGEPPPSTSPPTTLAPPRSIVPSTSLAPSPSRSLSETDVRALVDAWVLAQNGGDFPTYEAFYAARFDGIRRAGPRVRRFDRAGWMSDRRGMFTRPMHVEASDVSVAITGTTASVHLTQSFTEGTFHDEGPKELTVVREGDALRIAREEMVRSTVGATAASTVLAPGALMPIVSVGGQRFAVLAAVPEGADWHEGAPTLLSREGVVVTRARARSSAVPAALAALAGQAVVLAGGGARCDAQLGELAVLSRVDVHFGVEARWSGERDDGTQGAPSTPAEIASDAWGEGMLLVAALPDACPTAVTSRLASLPAAAALAQSPADAALAARVVAAFRALDAWTSVQASYVDTGGAGPRWDETGGASGPSVSVWSAPGDAHRFAVVSVSAGDGGCADFSASLWSVFEVAADGTLTRLTDASDPGSFSPLGAIDVDGTGRPVWIVEQGVVGVVGLGLGLVMDISPVVHDCYC